jgi:hypothetical protein
MRGSKGEESREYRFKLWFSDSAGSTNGVGVLIDKSLKNGVVDVRT